MNNTLHIVGICGSLRADSHSRALLRAMAELLPANATYREIDIGALPHYNEDLDSETPLQAVAHARQWVGAADAVLIVTPEFNHGLPGVLKNTLDWLSRPAFASCMIQKPVLFATLSPGALGGVRAQYQLRETLSSMLCQLFPLREIAIPYVDRKFDGARCTDEATLSHMRKALHSFLGQARLVEQEVAHADR